VVSRREARIGDGPSDVVLLEQLPVVVNAGVQLEEERVGRRARQRPHVTADRHVDGGVAALEARDVRDAQVRVASTSSHKLHLYTQCSPGPDSRGRGQTGQLPRASTTKWPPQKQQKIIT